MIKKFSPLIFISLFLFTGSAASAQEEINQHDAHGRRHGHWKEYFDNDKRQPKFEGQFAHGKKIGLFKFYQEGVKHPVALMEFDPGSEVVEAKYLTQKGKTISEGKMVDQQRTGLWTYYHKNSDKIMMIENYRNGELHGEKKIFYDNGVLAEEAIYVNGKLHGPRKVYSVKKVVLEDLNYENGELHGPAKYFNGKGELLNEGEYRRNKHHGTWRYYENGKFKEEKDF